jgi:hypothetical protein
VPTILVRFEPSASVVPKGGAKKKQLYSNYRCPDVSPVRNFCFLLYEKYRLSNIVQSPMYGLELM